MMAVNDIRCAFLVVRPHKSADRSSGCSRICSGQSTQKQLKTTAFNDMAATYSIESS
jgi:hypothetical protein